MSFGQFGKTVVGGLCIVVAGASIGGQVAVYASGPERSTNLFVDAEGTQDMQALSDPTIVRSRAVRIDFDLLEELRPSRGDTLEFSLFDGASLTLVVEETERESPVSYLLSGRVAGREQSSFILVVERRVMMGNIRVPGVGYYHVRYLGGRVHAVREIDDTQYPPCDGPLEPPPMGRGGRQGDGVPGVAAVDDGSVMDVLVVYTEDARVAAGGTDAMNALIKLAVANTTKSYGNSLISSELRLVHKAEVVYTETGDSGTDLAALQATADGKLDNVHTLRNTYCADMVSLFVATMGGCGRGYIMTSPGPGFAQWAFSVVKQSCAAGNLSFAHELGHNQGCHHDRENACSDDACTGECCKGDGAKEQGAGAYDYSYGYRYDGQYRTVMAYSTGCGSGCDRVQYFSNPNVNYLGKPTGVAGDHDDNAADNALTINNTKATVAQFKDSCLGTGACCDSLGDCTEQVENACDANGGDYQGDGTTCTPNPCNHPPECDANGPYKEECQGATTTLNLDGSASSDPDPGQTPTLSYSWTNVDCPGVVFGTPNSATTTLTVDSVAPCPLQCSVRLTVDDGKGGSDTCTAKVTVNDTTDPDITCPSDETVECDGAGNVAQLNAWIAGATASDTCGGTVITNDFTSLSDDCGETGSALVTWTATDDCGRTAQCSATFTIEDTTDPVIGSCPSDIFIKCADNPGEVVTFATPGASDVCDSAPTVTCDQPSGSFFPTGIKAADGTTLVTCTAVDDCGHTDSCSFDVTLVVCGACCNFDGSCTDDVQKNVCLSEKAHEWTKDTACADIKCATIPTVSEWALVVMTLLGCTVGTVIFGRRRAKVMQA